MTSTRRPGDPNRMKARGKYLSLILCVGGTFIAIQVRLFFFILGLGDNADTPSNPRQLFKLSNSTKDAVDRNVTKENSVPFKLPKPVFVVGFPKSGTSSIFEFFHCNGAYSQHWFCCGPQHDAQFGGPTLMSGCMLRNLANHTPILSNCGDYDVYAEINGPRRMHFAGGNSLYDLVKSGVLLDNGLVDKSGPSPRLFFPQRFHLEQIHSQFPNATFILNLRPLKAWVQSVMDWGNGALKFELANEYFMQNHSMVPRLPKNNTAMRAILSHIYAEHTAFMRGFVKDHPSHTLLEVNITDPNAGAVLASAFGLKEACWIHKNKNDRLRHQPRSPFSSSGFKILFFHILFFSLVCILMLCIRLLIYMLKS